MRVIIKCAPRRLIGIDCVNEFIVDNVAPALNYSERRTGPFHPILKWLASARILPIRRFPRVHPNAASATTQIPGQIQIQIQIEIQTF